MTAQQRESDVWTCMVW